MEKEKDYLKGYLSALSGILKTISKLDEDENVVELNILKNNVENNILALSNLLDKENNVDKFDHLYENYLDD